MAREQALPDAAAKAAPQGKSADLAGSWGRRALVGTGPYLVLMVVLLLARGLYPHQYQMHLANQILVQAIAALGVNIMMGFAGLISVAHGATMAVGAYSSALLMMKLGWPFPLAFLASCLICAVISGLVGALGSRVKTNYFLLITAGIHQAIFLVIVNERWLTGGPTGLFDVPPASFGGMSFQTDQEFYLLVVPIFVVALYLCQRLRQSKMGRAMVALRLNESAAGMTGNDVGRYRIVAMAVAGAYLAASGSLFAALIQFLGPESFALALALLLTLMVVVGGIGSNIGVVISVAGLSVATEQIRDTGNTWVLYYGLLIMILMVVAPTGMAGIWKLVTTKLFQWRGGAGPGATTTTPAPGVDAAVPVVSRVEAEQATGGARADS